MSRVTRRDFLLTAGKIFMSLPVAQFMSGRRAGFRSVRSQSLPSVIVAQGADSDTEEAILSTALDGIGGIERFIRPASTIVIKPNATWAYPPHTASSSDPEVLRALIRLVKKAGAGRIIVMDHCSIDPGTGPALNISGIGQIVKEEDVEGIFPDRNNSPLNTYTKIDLPDGKAFQKLGVIQAALEADLRINLAVAKTHNVTKTTMCLKHMMGFLQSPGLLHSDLEQGIADLSMPSSPIRADLHILEAIRVRMPYGSYRVCAGPETDITNPNVVKRRNQIIAGTDPVLIDAYACIKLFDMSPDELPYLMRAYEAGIGQIDIEAALQTGTMQVWQVGSTTRVQATSTLAAGEKTEQPQSSLTVTPEVDSGATSTPLPTATTLPEGSQAVGIHAASSQACDQIIDPRPIIGPVIAPAAMVITGISVAISSVRQRASGSRSGEKDDRNE